MSKISGKDTKPEVAVRKFLFAEGYRFRKNKKDLPGKPDIVLAKYGVAVFVNGCFWHGHNRCNRGTRPNSNAEFWNDKISKNRIRDKRNYYKLKRLGWRVLVIWGCELKNKTQMKKTLSRLAEKIERF